MDYSQQSLVHNIGVNFYWAAGLESLPRFYRLGKKKLQKGMGGWSTVHFFIQIYAYGARSVGLIVNHRRLLI